MEQQRIRRLVGLDRDEPLVLIVSLGDRAVDDPEAVPCATVSSVTPPASTAVALVGSGQLARCSILRWPDRDVQATSRHIPACGAARVRAAPGRVGAGASCGAAGVSPGHIVATQTGHFGLRLIEEVWT
jgi:hypothetical protein